MAEGGHDPGVQSDTASEDIEHSSPLDTIGSMTQSLSDLEPPKKQRGSCAGKKVRRGISKQRGAREFLASYEQRVLARNTSPDKSLEESEDNKDKTGPPPLKIARCEPFQTSPGVGAGRAHILRWMLYNTPNHFDYGDGPPIGEGCSAAQGSEEWVRPRFQITLMKLVWDDRWQQSLRFLDHRSHRHLSLIHI